MSRNSTWTNPDGLIIGFGGHSKDDNVPRSIAGPGNMKEAQLTVVWSDLDPFGTVTTAALRPQGITLPRGSRIVSGSFVVNVGFVGATADLIIGTYKADGTVSTVDLNEGIMRADVALLATIGLTHVCAGSLVNGTALAGSVSDSDVVIVAQQTTANFTAGEGVLTIRYYEPTYSSSTTPAFT